MSLAILVVLVLGIGAGFVLPENISAFIDSASSYMLLVLLFSVGIDMGLNKEVFTRIKELGFKILLIPAGVIIGSLCGGVLTSFLVQLSVKDSLAISAGLGWYSLSGILITEAGNPVAGTIAFLSNVFREMLTFIVVPFIASHLNYYCARTGLQDPADPCGCYHWLSLRRCTDIFSGAAFCEGQPCDFRRPWLVQPFRYPYHRGGQSCGRNGLLPCQCVP